MNGVIYVQASENLLNRLRQMLVTDLGMRKCEVSLNFTVEQNVATHLTEERPFLVPESHLNGRIVSEILPIFTEADNPVLYGVHCFLVALRLLDGVDLV